MALITRTSGDIQLTALGTGTNDINYNGDITLRADQVIITNDLVVLGTLFATIIPSPDFASNLITLNNVETTTNLNADGGGITLYAAADKTLHWLNATNAWTSNVNVDISDTTKTFRIGGATVISNTALGEGIAVDGGTY